MNKMNTVTVPVKFSLGGDTHRCPGLAVSRATRRDWEVNSVVRDSREVPRPGLERRHWKMITEVMSELRQHPWELT